MVQGSVHSLDDGERDVARAVERQVVEVDRGERAVLHVGGLDLDVFADEAEAVAERRFELVQLVAFERVLGGSYGARAHDMAVRVGDAVTRGQPLAWIRAADRDAARRCADRVSAAVTVGDDGGEVIEIDAGWPAIAHTVVIVAGGSNYPCYSGRAGEAYSPVPVGGDASCHRSTRRMSSGHRPRSRMNCGQFLPSGAQ